MKVYVGQTTDFDTRMRRHLGGHGSRPLTHAINEHGRKKIVCVKLPAGIKEQEELDSVEWLVIHHLLARGNMGYNCINGGGGATGLGESYN